MLCAATRLKRRRNTLGFSTLETLAGRSFLYSTYDSCDCQRKLRLNSVKLSGIMNYTCSCWFVTCKMQIAWRKKNLTIVSLNICTIWLRIRSVLQWDVTKECQKLQKRKHARLANQRKLNSYYVHRYIGQLQMSTAGVKFVE